MRPSSSSPHCLCGDMPAMDGQWRISRTGSVILYDECSEDMRGEYNSAKYTMRNLETLTKLSGLNGVFLRNFQT